MGEGGLGGRRASRGGQAALVGPIYTCRWPVSRASAVHVSNSLRISAHIYARAPLRLAAMDRGRTLLKTSSCNREPETPRPVWRPEPPAPPLMGVRVKGPPPILKIGKVTGWPYGLPDFWTWDEVPQYQHWPGQPPNPRWWE